MAYRKVLTWPNPGLKAVAEPVQDFSSIQGILQDMYDTLNVKMGAGLAATQIGLGKRIVIIKCSSFGAEPPTTWDYDKNIWVLINPEISVSSEDYQVWEEACLSVPGASGLVRRHQDVKVDFLDPQGNSHSVDIPWPLAGAVQHECDHLDGILYIDRMNKKSATDLKRRLIWIRNQKKKKALKLARALKREKKQENRIDTRVTHGPGKRKRKKKKK